MDTRENVCAATAGRWHNYGHATALIAILAASATAASYFLWPAPVRGQAPTTTKAYFSRDTIYLGDPDRDYVAFWSRGNPADPNSYGLRLGTDATPDGKAKLEIELVASDGVRFAVKSFPLRQQEQLESWYWQAIRPTVPMGTYRVEVNGRPHGSLQVSRRNPGTIRRLSAGEYRSDYTLTTPTQLRGHGCTLTGNLIVSPGCTISGLTIDGNVSGSFHDCVFDSCTFRRGLVGHFQPTDKNVVFKDCKFIHAACWQLNTGLFLRCEWIGVAPDNRHSFCTESGFNLAVVDCTFDRTDRGLVLRPWFGNNSDNLYAGIWFRDIAMTPNGSELVCVEGVPYEMSRNLFFALRQSGCVGGVSLFDSKANDNLFNNVRLPVDITGIKEQRGNVVQDSECEYVRINWPGQSQATGTVLKNVYSVGFRPRARNQATGDPRFWHDTKFDAVMVDGSPSPTTRGYNLRVIDSDGMTAVKGIR